MTVNELIKELQTLKKIGKGDYVVRFIENELITENIELQSVDDKVNYVDYTHK